MSERKFERLVMLEWVDSHSPEGGVWVDAEEVSTGLMVMQSVGFIHSECEQSITIVSHTSIDDQCTQVSGAMTIPKCAITRQVELKPPAQGQNQ